MSNFLEYALKYAALGWKVFPLLPSQKIPYPGTHGVKDATDDGARIREWWTKWPTANIGLACGEDSRIYVIDVDVEKSTGVNGYDSLAEFPDLPKTICQDTPRGGFHAFYTTGNPPANRNGFRKGIDIRGNGYYVVLPPSVHPNGGLYKWKPGCAPWELAAAEFPLFMRPTVRPPWVASPAPLAITGGDDYETTRRAQAYVDACPGAISGQGGHNATFPVAQVLVRGFLLSDDVAMQIFREWNQTCIPPWSERELLHKIKSAHEHPCDKPDGWLLNEIDIGVSIDVESLLNSQVAKPADAQDLKSCGDIPRVGSIPTLAIKSGSSEATSSTPQLGDGGLKASHRLKGESYCLGQGPDGRFSSEFDFITRPTGLLGEICSWINRTALKEQPILTLACSVAFLGALFGRKVKDALGSRTNLYCMGVAPSSAGKAHAPNQIRRICESVGCIDLLGGDTIASDSAIEERMSRNPATLFLWDEIGHLLSHIRSGVSKNHAQVVSLLMKLYSSAGSVYKGREYAEQERQRTIAQPCCCIYGTSTPERFTAGFTAEELQDGWLSRCLVFKSDSNPEKKRGISELQVPLQIVESVRAWHTRLIQPTEGNVISAYVSPGYYQAPPAQLLVPTDPEAEKIFISLDHSSASIVRDWVDMKCLFAKAEENARRIALIVAAGERFDNPVITPAIADYSCRLIKYILQTTSHEIVRDISAKTETERAKNRIIDVIDATGVDGCVKRDITRKTHGLNKRHRNDLLDDLIEAEEIAVELEGKKLKYWTVENFLKRLAAKDRK